VIDQAQLIEYARTRLAGYKTPRQLVVVEQVQRAANGKSDYKWAKTVALEAVG
jgi:fatty-acyl-CoA synthase